MTNCQQEPTVEWRRCVRLGLKVLWNIIIERLSLFQCKLGDWDDRQNKPIRLSIVRVLKNVMDMISTPCSWCYFLSITLCFDFHLQPDLYQTSQICFSVQLQVDLHQGLKFCFTFYLQADVKIKAGSFPLLFHLQADIHQELCFTYYFSRWGNDCRFTSIGFT
jgi:hypothetical protein